MPIAEFTLSDSTLLDSFSLQADGVLVFAYPDGNGGIDDSLEVSLQKLSQEVPVLIWFGGTDFNGDLKLFDNPNIFPVGESDISEVLVAKKIYCPALIMLNPAYAQRWAKTFGQSRIFVVSEMFKRWAGENAQLRAQKDWIDAEIQMLLERHCDWVFVSTDETRLWLRDEFRFMGQQTPIDELLKLPFEVINRLSATGHNPVSRTHPHRLDVLLCFDASKAPPSQKEQIFKIHDQSRHNIYLVGSSAVQGDNSANLDGFDVVVLVAIGNEENMSGLPGLLKKFRGAKVTWGYCHTGGPEIEGAIAVGTGPVESVDVFDWLMARLMPGVANWQLHEVTDMMSHKGATYCDLHGKFGAGMKQRHQSDNIERMREAMSEYHQGEKQLIECRSRKSVLDGEIEHLSHQIEKLKGAGK